jgi:uncharacterized protein (UPF0548 family)
MFLALRPSPKRIDRFIRECEQLPLSYAPVGIVRTEPVGRRFDEAVVTIGRGASDFRRAQRALRAWKQFDIGWVELFPRYASTAAGTNVAVLIRHLGFWSLNGARVVYGAGRGIEDGLFGFAYGTLGNHAEAGEELFEVALDEHSGDVTYRIRAMSWPHAPVTRIGQPIVRLLQARFRRDSLAAMTRAITRRAERP